MAESAGDPKPGRRLNARLAVAGLEITLLGILVALAGATQAAMVLGTIGALLVLLSL